MTNSGTSIHWLRGLLVVAVIIVAAGSLTACGKKGGLEKPGATTETKKKPTY